MDFDGAVLFDSALVFDGAVDLSATFVVHVGHVQGADYAIVRVNDQPASSPL